MKFLIPAVLGAPFLLAQAAHAVEVTGGSVQLSYSAFTDDTDVSNLGLEGSVEFGFNRNISVQTDLGFYGFGLTDEDVTSIGLHGIYHVSEATSFGAFFNNESFDTFDTDFYGIEAGHEAVQWDLEGYVGRLDDGASESTLFGASARYELANAVGVTGSYQRIDLDGGTDLNRVGVKFDRDVGQSFNIFAEVGAATITTGANSDSETYVGIGGKYVFGADRGATFEQRSFSRFLPGL